MDSLNYYQKVQKKNQRGVYESRQLFKLFSNNPNKRSRSLSFWVLWHSTWKSQQEVNRSNMASQLNLYVNNDSETWSPLAMAGNFAFKIIQKRFTFISMRLKKAAAFSSFLWKNGSRNRCTGVSDLESLQNWDLCIISCLAFLHVLLCSFLTARSLASSEQKSLASPHFLLQIKDPPPQSEKFAFKD